MDAMVATRIAEALYGNAIELVYLVFCEFHVHVYGGALIFFANLGTQLVLMILEVLTGVHSLVFLNPRLAGGWLRAMLRQRDEASHAATMERAVETVRLRVAASQKKGDNQQ